MVYGVIDSCNGTAMTRYGRGCNAHGKSLAALYALRCRKYPTASTLTLRFSEDGEESYLPAPAWICYIMSVGTVPMLQIITQQSAAGRKDGKCISQKV